ncbi:MAG: hypothetical protein JWP29_1223 [Rhodoferax sp.]|nr:hypothetical protein [Rhodoferax sp.]
MKITIHYVLWLCALASLTGASSAGVIVGTGDQPTSDVLGRTDAMGFEVTDSGAGHTLIVPYYTVQNQQLSVLHLVNTDTANGKVVKLRFRGASNGDSLLSLQVLLAAGDVWTGALAAGADGRAQIITGDLSCTYPRLLPGVSQPFLTERLNPALAAPALAAQTREGSIEAFVTADIPAPASGAPDGTASALYTTILHTNGVPPCADSVLSAALMHDTESESVAASRGFATPTGGVAGTWYILDVVGSTTFSGDATAIRAINSAGKTARGNYLLFPQSADAVPNPERYTADPLLVSAGLASRVKQMDGSTSQATTAPAVVARFHDFPDLSTPYYLPASAVNARTTAGQLTQRLATVDIKNQYAIDFSISAKTDWVLAMPTRRYSVAYDYGSADINLPLLFSVLPTGGIEPQLFGTWNSSAINGVLCYGFQVLLADREGRTTVPTTDLFAKTYRNICGVVGVLSIFDPGNSVLSASITRTNHDWNYVNGWATVFMDGYRNAPVIGSAFMKLTNPNATPGVVGNYGLTFPHMRTAP